MAVCVMKKGVVDYDAVTLVLVLQYTAEMGWINSIFGRFLMIQNQLRRAGEFLDLDRIPQEQYKAKQNQDDRKELDNWPAKGTIEFDKVELRYRKNTDLVLKGLSFSIGSNEKIGIVGRTGAGKSTISAALSRLVELAGGRILIDGVDIASLDLDKLRENMTFIP